MPETEAGNIAIIGGTGLSDLPPEIFAESLEIETRFGAARLSSLSDNYTEPRKLYFLARHGPSHRLAPHQINVRANIAALVQLGVGAVFAVNAVGSLRRDLPPGSLLLLHDFIDFTRQRPLTYPAEAENWTHTDFSVPYSPRLRQAMQQAAQEMEIPLRPQGVYLCCDGPRFETPAEIRMFAAWGADVIGMTGLPELIFAREAGLEYASLAIVTNYGAGMTERPVSHESHVHIMEDSQAQVRELLLRASRIAHEASSASPPLL